MGICVSRGVLGPLPSPSPGHSDPGRSRASLLDVMLSCGCGTRAWDGSPGLLFCVKWAYFGQCERVSGLCPHVNSRLCVPVAVRAVQNASVAIATRRFVDLCDYLIYMSPGVSRLRVSRAHVVWPCKIASL